MSIKDVTILRLSVHSTTKQATIEKEFSELGIDFETNNRIIIVKPKDDDQKSDAISTCFFLGFSVPKSAFDLIEPTNYSLWTFPPLWFSTLLNAVEDKTTKDKTKPNVLGWHVNCVSCDEILCINEVNQRVVQHHYMFVNCYCEFRELLEDIGIYKQIKCDRKDMAKYFKSLQEHCDDVNKYFQEKSDHFKREGNEKLAEDFKTIIETSEGLVKNKEELFNCDRYEECLRAIGSIKETMGLANCLIPIFLLPFDFPQDNPFLDSLKKMLKKRILKKRILMAKMMRKRMMRKTIIWTTMLEKMMSKRMMLKTIFWTTTLKKMMRKRMMRKTIILTTTLKKILMKRLMRKNIIWTTLLKKIMRKRILMFNIVVVKMMKKITHEKKMIGKIIGEITLEEKKMAWDKTQFNLLHQPHDHIFGQYEKQASRCFGLFPIDTFPANCHGGSTEGKRTMFHPTSDDPSDYEFTLDEKEYDVDDPNDLIVSFIPC